MKASGALFPLEFHPMVDLLQVIFGVGGLIAATGALLYIIVTVWSVFLGKPFDESAKAAKASGIPQGILNLPPQQYVGVKVSSAEKVGTPGTVVLVGIFFVCFVIYYGINWLFLSFLWKVG